MQDIIIWSIGTIISLGAALTGWVFKMVFSQIKDIQIEHDFISKSLAAHKLHAAETFATKVDVEKGFTRVMDKLEKIDEKLDRKVDKQ